MAVSSLGERNCEDLCSDEDIEIIEVSTGESTPKRFAGARGVESQCDKVIQNNIHPLGDSTCTTITEQIEQKVESYQEVLIRRLSGLGNCIN